MFYVITNVMIKKIRISYNNKLALTILKLVYRSKVWIVHIKQMPLE